MKKLLILLLTLAVTPIIAGCYGIIHDQFTYTISHEYFTKFKFYQFGFIEPGYETILPNPRLYVAIVGFLATWWVGLIIGIGNGLMGLIQKDHKLMFKTISYAVFITLIATAISGLIGLAYGWFYLSGTQVNWYLPKTLINKKSFIAVGSMHNFGYLGGLTGLVLGMIYQVVKASKNRTVRKTLH
ncbi:hypothetical protein [Mucilaginibacter sp.]|uniref:hypothetical protein n=1 Tax=Mucilaginibacter sp. TaxID=1882438 RepID=UPI002ED5306A